MKSKTKTPPLRLGVIVASVRDGRFAPKITDWFTRQATERGGFDIDVIDVKDEPLSMVMPSLGHELDARTEGTLASLTPRLEAAEAFIVVTPEYNHSFPAALKNLIDWHLTEWRAKPVGFVSYGGVSAGLRAVEHLRLVLAEVHAVTIRDSVCFHSPWERLTKDGAVDIDDVPVVAAKQMLDQLEWWAIALRQARRAQPYPA